MPSAIGSVRGEFAVHKHQDVTKQPTVATELELQHREIYTNDGRSGLINGSHSHNEHRKTENALSGNMRSSNDNVSFASSMEPKARREIVELIDPEPTFDYLVLHGVLTRNDVSDIVQEPEPSQQNRKLLELVESRPDIAGVQLLTNVLRLTGQHYLANLLDDGARIKALSGSGYLSKSRHRGQVGITVRITSMQLPSDPQLKAVSALLGTEWISLEDIQTKMSSLKRSQRSSVAHPDTLCIKSADDTVVTEAGTVDKKDRCWCCCCCRKGSSTSTKKAAQKYELSNTNVNANPGDVTLEQQMRELEKKDTVVTIQPGRIKSASVECVNFGDATIGRFGSNMNSLRRAADSVQGRCTAIYNKINEPGTPLRIGIERYFEQDRGILVLNTESLGVGSGVTVVCICTLLEHAQKLREDQYKRLTSDLERVISNAYGTPVRLEVKVDDNELDLVELEMASR